MTDREYQSNELRRFHAEMADKERCFFGSVSEFADSLTERDWILEQLEWIENGSYGAGACFALQRVANSLNKRTNDEARVGGFLLSCLYGCEFRHWHRLPAAVQANVGWAVRRWIRRKRNWAATLAE